MINRQQASNTSWGFKAGWSYRLAVSQAYLGRNSWVHALMDCGFAIDQFLSAWTIIKHDELSWTMLIHAHPWSSNLHDGRHSLIIHSNKFGIAKQHWPIVIEPSPTMTHLKHPYIARRAWEGGNGSAGWVWHLIHQCLSESLGMDGSGVNRLLANGWENIFSMPLMMANGG